MIETSHLSKVYRKGVYALRDLSLNIEKGEFLFITRPSGSGKAASTDKRSNRCPPVDICRDSKAASGMMRFI